MHLHIIDSYLDAVPRTASHVVEVGPFSLFVGDGPYPYYARPSCSRDAAHRFEPDEVRAAVRTQRELGVPVAFEWVDDLDPSLTRACSDAGLHVVHRPLLARSASEAKPRTNEPSQSSVRIQIVDPLDASLIREQRSVAHVGFGHGGTAVANVGTSERDAVSADPTAAAWTARRIGEGATVVAVAVDEIDGVVGAGSLQPVRSESLSAAELTGIAVLPSHRRRGIASSITSALITHGASLRIEMLLLSAQGDEVARIYERVGFVRVGTVGEAASAATSAVADSRNPLT